MSLLPGPTVVDGVTVRIDNYLDRLVRAKPRVITGGHAKIRPARF